KGLPIENQLLEVSIRPIEQTPPVVERPNTFQVLLQNAKAKKQPIICLPVLVPGEPYSGDREQRMRIRYALNAALAVRGYTLSFPDRMSYVELPITIFLEDIDQIVRVKRLIVPLKLLKGPND